ncbi:MAG TPA: hypothetical protein VLA43_07845 [Longimicrobiales bacterium]|nr:hypothetical protein [Longimicrobiales bacterium]
MTMTKWTGGAVVALLAAGLMAGGAQAQAVSATGDEEIRVEKAQALEAAAREAAEVRAAFREASRLYRQAAEIRGDQPEAAQSLMMAGALAYYVGSEGQAIKDLTRAGELALAWGDVVTAAQAFLDASWVAAKEGRQNDAAELGRRAERLSASPLIQRQERGAILNRIGDLLN